MKQPDQSVYSLDPAGSETLARQLAGNLRRAFAKGVIKKGDVLPGVREMARLCGTSVRVPIMAVKTLTDEGMVKARPRIGCVVLEPNRRVWHGSVLLVHVGNHANYSQNVFANEFAINLESANWRVEHVFVPRREGTGSYDLKMLKKRLKERTDLVILPAFDPPVVKCVRDSGYPYVLMHAEPGETGETCVGTLLGGGDMQACSDLADHCRKRGVRRIVEVTFDEQRGILGMQKRMLRELTWEQIVVRPAHSPLRVESFTRCAYEALLKRLTDKRAPRPDLLFFCDDFLARGGFWALNAAGLRVPDDVGVVTTSNYGNAPFYPVPLTRIESNQYDDAAKVARSVLRFLRTGRFGGIVIASTRYVPGETF